MGRIDGIEPCANRYRRWRRALHFMLSGELARLYDNGRNAGYDIISRRHEHGIMPGRGRHII